MRTKPFGYRTFDGALILALIRCCYSVATIKNDLADSIKKWILVPDKCMRASEKDELVDCIACIKQNKQINLLLTSSYLNEPTGSETIGSWSTLQFGLAFYFFYMMMTDDRLTLPDRWYIDADVWCSCASIQMINIIVRSCNVNDYNPFSHSLAPHTHRLQYFVVVMLKPFKFTYLKKKILMKTNSMTHWK